jgi:hypothetical protein
MDNQETGYNHLFFEDREMFLQECCYELDRKGVVVTPESLAGAQTLYDLEACKKFIDDLPGREWHADN